MQPEVIAWFVGIILVIIKAVQLAFIWDNREEE
jgi:hypothetical protein